MDRFTMGGVSYQFRVLCFGLTTAPHVFTQLMAPISAFLHHYSVRMLRYLDNWLILAESRPTGLKARDRLLQVCEELGLQVNFRKSSLIPSQDMTYLGMQIQSVRFIAKPTATRVENLLKIIEEFLSSPGPPAALWRHLLGHLSSLTLLVKGGMLRMRSLQVRLPKRITSHPLGSSVSGGSFMVVLGNSRREGVDLSVPVPDLSFYSDASDVGWGAIVREHQVSGVRTPSQRELSINLRETMAVQKGLFEFGSLLRGKTIALFCDNVTTVAYLRRLGGMRSQVLFLKAREILLWVESMKITLLPRFIQGSLDTRADLLSRPNLVMGSEWTLHREVVQDLLHQWLAIIDLFATSLTARLPVFFVPAWEPKAAGVGCIPPALGQSSGVCFSSHSHHKESSSQTENLSRLRSDSHRPLLALKGMELLPDIPIELPKRRDLLQQPHFNRFHENLPMLRLTAWRLKRFAGQAGFSETVAGQLAPCRRKSTRLNYQARWGKFRTWCWVFHHRSSEPTIPKVAECLTFFIQNREGSCIDYQRLQSDAFFCV